MLTDHWCVYVTFQAWLFLVHILASCLLSSCYKLSEHGGEATSEHGGEANNPKGTKEVGEKLVVNSEDPIHDIAPNSKNYLTKYGSEVARSGLRDNLLHKNGSEFEQKCFLELHKGSINQFRHIVYYGDLSLVMLHLNVAPPLSLKPSKDIVGVGHWVWTYYGQRGGLEFLTWPSEFQIWSLGLLYTYVGDPLVMNISRYNGSCTTLEVGQYETDMTISTALVALQQTLHFVQEDGQYDPSFWCYRRRKYLNPKYLYLICKHIVCPFVAIQYSCCRYFYIIAKGQREVQCYQHFSYDQIWWMAPIVAAVLLFSFCPLIILKVAGAFRQSSKESNVDNLSTDYVFLSKTDHVTLLNTLFSPISSVSKAFPVCLSRTVRFVLPFLSFTFIRIQIYLDHLHLPYYVRECVNKGVPMGFRSMASGYKESARNFLPFLGGPYVASAIYLVITTLLVTVPTSMYHTLTAGLGVSFDTPRNADDVSPLRLSFSILESYGSVPIRKRHGYKRIYAVYVAQLNLLINIKFWKFVYNLQLHRWQNIRRRAIRLCILPIYIMLCSLEIVLCILVYGFPVVSFGITIFRAYRNLLLRTLHNRLWKPLVLFASALLIACIVFFMFMFCTIFLDACLFIARLCIFTYTGIIIYPRVSYGYLIFVATVFYYLWDAIQNFSRYYFQLLRMSVSVSESVQRSCDIEPLVKRSGGFKGIRKDLFDEIIEKYCPRRKKVIVSFLRVFIILGVVGLSVHLLMKTNRFQDLHVIMHVGTTLLICALPKIMKSLCSGQNSKIVQTKARAEIKSIIKATIGYMSDDTEDCSD